VVQTNGKIRDRLMVPAGASDEAVTALAMALPKVVAMIAGKTPKKVIVVKNRLVNVIV
jgi:leucyl-tRNA synthetase